MGILVLVEDTVRDLTNKTAGSYALLIATMARDAGVVGMGLSTVE